LCGFRRTTATLNYIRKLTRLRVVDNSAIGRAAELAGKPAKCIHIYNKTGFGYLGDKVFSHCTFGCLLFSVFIQRLAVTSSNEVGEVM